MADEIEWCGWCEAPCARTDERVRIGLFDGGRTHQEVRLLAACSEQHYDLLQRTHAG